MTAIESGITTATEEQREQVRVAAELLLQVLEGRAEHDGAGGKP